MKDDLRCPKCGYDTPPGASRCEQCGQGLSGRALLAADASGPTQTAPRHGASVLARICYGFTLLGAVIGTLDMVSGLTNATGAPQQAAAAAMGAAYAVIPYVFARAVDELTR